MILEGIHQIRQHLYQKFLGKSILATLTYAGTPPGIILARLPMTLADVGVLHDEEDPPPEKNPPSQLTLMGDIIENDSTLLAPEVSLPLPEDDASVWAQAIGGDLMIRTAEGMELQVSLLTKTLFQ